MDTIALCVGIRKAYWPDAYKVADASSFLLPRVSRPVLPGEEREYFATQVIAEYLATQHSPRLDGVVFSSAQYAGGLNLVLFSHALSRLSALDDDGPSVLLPQSELTPRGIEFIPDSLRVYQLGSVKFRYQPPRKIVDGKVETFVEDC